MRGGQVIDLQRFSTPGHDTVRTPGVAQSQRNLQQALPCTLVIERCRNRAIENGSVIYLTPRETDVLEQLTAPGVHLSQDILRAVWGNAHDGNLKVQICNLRKKIAPLGYHIDSYIRRGYELVKEGS